MYTGLNERDTEVLIDSKLYNLGWKDISHSNKRERNIWRQLPKTSEQKSALQGKKPDYILYGAGRDFPLAIIEAKKQGKDLNKALEQGILYAKKIKANIVFASDGVFVKSYHIKDNKSLVLDGEEVRSFLPEKILENFIEDGVYDRRSNIVINSKNQLIDIFREANRQLRNDGLTAGIERIGVFSSILFLKLISEIEDIKESNGEKSKVPKECRWGAFSKKDGFELLNYLNDTAIRYFSDFYGDDIFIKLKISKPAVLQQIIKLLTPLQFNDINTDIKGDAFEYFLKTYNAGYKDLGEYFTPRHIIELMVKIINPRLGETIYDPFCGTGGMLISAFNHIKENTIFNEHIKTILKNHTVFGNDITSTSRIAKMNMILAGDGHSNIKQLDSLENPVEKKYDIVITNMPFSLNVDHVSHLYHIQSKNSNNICIQHCFNAIKEGGRMALVVPDGILTKKDTSDRSLREYIYDNSNVESVFSLPAGLFSPYSDTVKTNILIIKDISTKQGQNKNFYFYRIKDDGYSFGAKRKKKKAYNDINYIEDNFFEKNGFIFVDKEEIEKNNHILTATYKHFIIKNKISKKLGNFCIEKKKLAGKDFEDYNVATVSSRQGLVYQSEYYKKEIASEDRTAYKIVRKNDFVYRPPGLDIGTIAINKLEEDVIVSSSYVVFAVDGEEVDKDYLLYIIKSSVFLEDVISPLMRGSARPLVPFPIFKELFVPIPSIEKQLDITKKNQKEIEKLQKEILKLKNQINNQIIKEW